MSLLSDEEAVNMEHIDGNIIILGADNIFGLDVLQKMQGLVHINTNQSIKFQNKTFKFGEVSTGESMCSFLFVFSLLRRNYFP